MNIPNRHAAQQISRQHDEKATTTTTVVDDVDNEGKDEQLERWAWRTVQQGPYRLVSSKYWRKRRPRCVYSVQKQTGHLSSVVNLGLATAR